MTNENNSAIYQVSVTKDDEPNRRKKVCSFLKDSLLLILTILGILIGFIIGFSIRTLHPSADALMWLGLPGDVFLRLLKMMIIPLIASCIISGAANLDPKCNGKISLVAILYIMGTNCICAAVGLILAEAIHPGHAGDQSNSTSNFVPKTKTADIFADLIRNVFPDNLIGACIRKVHTTYLMQSEMVTVNRTLNGSSGVLIPNVSWILVNETLTKEIRNVGYADGANLIGVVFASLVFGIATCLIGEPAKPFYTFFEAASLIIYKIFGWFIWYSPIGIASLTAAAIASVEDPGSAFVKLGFYVLTVTVGVIFHQVLLLPGLSLISMRKNPFLLYYYQVKGWLLIFATTTGIVCIPFFAMGCERFGVDKRISRFVIPFSQTVSKNGSAIFITASVLFIAQLNDIRLEIGNIFVVWLLTSVLVFALPDIPSGSIVILMIILQATGLPVTDIATLFTVEWFLDRARSSSNGMAHCFCTVFVYGLCKGDIDRIDKEKYACGADACSNDLKEKQAILASHPDSDGYAEDDDEMQL